MSNFIHSIKSGSCPSCYSTNVSSQGNYFTCNSCGNRWTEEDSNFAKGMTPSEDEREEARKRTLEKLDEDDFDV